LIEASHLFGLVPLFFHEIIPLTIHDPKVFAKHRILVSDQPEEKIITAQVRVTSNRFLIDACVKGFLEHVDELINERQLENLFVDNSKHDFELLVDLPFQ